MNFYKLLMGLFIFLITFGCKNNDKNEQAEIDIKGHWHINETDLLSRVQTMDISDSLILFNDNRIGLASGGSWISIEHNSIIKSETKYTGPAKKIFNYSFYNDTLILEDVRNNSTYKGIKFPKECKFELDAYVNKIIDIDLPVIDTTLVYSPMNHQLEFVMGYPKEEYLTKYGDSIRLNFDRKLLVPKSTLSSTSAKGYNRKDILSMEEYLRVIKHFKHRPSYHQRPKGKGNFSILIHADKMTPMSQIIKIIDAQKKVGDTDMFIVGKKAKEITELSELTMLDVTDAKARNETQTIEDWIKDK